MLIFS
jgi:hypothetical protein